MNVLITNLAPSGTKVGDKTGRKQPIIKALKHLTASGQKVPKWLANEALDYSISEPSLFSAEEVQACMDSILDTKAPSIAIMNKAIKSKQDVPMSRRRAKLLAEYANRLSQMLENAPDDKDLAEWVQSKIDRAASAIQSAFHYLEYDELEKGASHKYIRRIPKGRDKRTGRMRYDYVYKEHHRGGLRAAVDDLKAGEAFKLTDPKNGQKGHFHVKGVKGNVVVVEHDETGRSVTMTKAEFKALLMKEHGQALKDNFQAKKETYERMKRESPKSIGLKAAFNRLKAAAEKAGVKVPQVQTAPEQASKQSSLSKEQFKEKIEELKNLEDKLSLFLNTISTKQFLTPEQEKKVIEEQQAEIAEKRKQLTEGFKRPQSFEELETRLRKLLPKLKGLDYNRITGYKLYIDEENIASLRSQIKDLVGTGLYISQTNEKNYGLQIQRASYKDMTRLLFALENEAKQKTAPEPAARAQLIDTAKPEPAQPAKIDNFELSEHTHTKTGVKLYTAKQKDRVDRDEFKRRVQIAKKYKGRYDSRYAKAYLFKNPEDARKFALEVEGKPTDSPTTAPATNNFETMPEAESVDNFETMPESKLSDPHRARKEKVFKEVTTGELYQTRALIDENEIRGVYENQTLASLKRNLEPDRLAAESGIQESGLLQGIENATRISQLAKEYKDFQVRTAITFDRKDKAVLNERGNPRGISDFIREKLNLNSVKDVRAQKDEIEKIASELLKLGVDNAVKRAKETATKRKNKISADGISIFDNHITEAEKRLEFIQTSNLKDSKKLIDGIREAIKLTKEAKEVYKQKSGNLLDQAISENSNQAIINGLLENSSTRFHFTINPKGSAAKKLTETIVQSTLSNVLKDVAQSQDNFETMPEVELPPKGERTVEDAKKWFGEPTYFETKMLTGTKRYFQYEKDGLTVRGGPIGAKGQLLAGSKVYTSINLTPENRKKISGAQFSQTELGEYRSIDEALRAAINYFDKDPQSQFIGFQNRDLERDRQSAARRMGVKYLPARTELIEASDVVSDKTDGLKGSYWDRNERPEIKRLLDETASRGRYQSTFQTGYTPSLYDLKQVVQSADKLKLVDAWNQNQDTHNRMVSFAEEGDLESLKKILSDFRTDYLSMIARNSLHNGYGKRAKRVIRDSKTSAHRELAKQEYLDFEKEYVARAKQIFEETRTETDAQIIQHLKERYFRYKDRPSEFSTAPRLTPSERAQITKRFDEAAARAQLIEASDQSAESAAVRITQGLTEEKLTDFSKDLTDGDVSQIYDRTRFLTVAKEKPTKTLMRSKKQRAIDNELILMHQRLDIHAKRKFGSLAPRVTEGSRYHQMFKEGTREPEHREKIRAKIKKDIEKLHNVLKTTAKSAEKLINYRAALYKALNQAA